LAPLQYLNIASLYSRFSSLVDFFIFLALFVGAARVAFGKKFEGQGGKAITVALGIILAIGMSLAEARWGFNVASFGSLAVIFLLVAFGALFFYSLVSMGVHKPTALAWAFVMTYTFLQTLSVRLFQWIQSKFSVINLLFLIALVFALVKAFMAFNSGPLKRSAELLRKAPEYIKSIPLQEEKQERKVIKDDFKTVRKERKTNWTMIEALKEIRKLIEEYGNTEKGRKAIAKQLTMLSSQEGKLMQKLGHLDALDKRLEELDIIAVRKLQDEYGKVPEGEKNRIAREIEAEKEKFRLGEKMNNMEYEIKKRIANFNIAIRLCIQCIGKGQTEQALQNVDAAMRFQLEIDKLFEEMERIGIFLTGLTQREYKAMKKEVKAA
jgi:hypothetical protein